ncbi:hypothetical protein ACMYSL_10475 [Klebsiella sp. MISC125]|uniref:hypothetical protein n=1 Tax=Klebsiella sp. MISC125 TaxID=2755386 RepID=UPI0038D304E7
MQLLSKVPRVNVYIASFILCVILAFGLLMYSYHHKSGFDCSANMRIESGSSGFDASFKTFLLMRGNHSGYFDVSGKVMINDVRYTVERSYHFDYEVKENNIYHLVKTSLSKRDADNVIEGVMQKVFFSPDPDSGRYIKIQKMKNTYVVQNLYSPSFICVSN